MKANKIDDAIRLFCELKRFDEAQRFLKMGQTVESKAVMSTLIA